MERKKKADLPVLVWRPSLFLPRAVRDLLAEADRAPEAALCRAHRPSLAVALALTVLGLLMAGGALSVAVSMFIRETVPATPLRLVLGTIFFGLGLVFLYHALRLGWKHVRHRRYFLYLHPDYLLERSAGHVTLIPRGRLLFVWGRRELRLRGADLTWDSIGWRGPDGASRVYDLKDHYWPAGARPGSAPHDWRLIRRFYALGGPPPGFHGRPE